MKIYVAGKLPELSFYVTEGAATPVKTFQEAKTSLLKDQQEENEEEEEDLGRSPAHEMITQYTKEPEHEARFEYQTNEEKQKHRHPLIESDRREKRTERPWR